MAYEKLLGKVVGKDGVTYTPKIENYNLSWISSDDERAVETPTIDLSPYIYVPELDSECNLIYRLKKYNPTTKTLSSIPNDENITIEAGNIKGEHGDNIIHMKILESYDELENLENKSHATIYYIPKDNGTFDGYIYDANNELKEIQSTINLDNYYTIEEINTKLSAIENTQAQIISLLG